MSDFLDRIANLSPKRLALLAIELNDQVEADKRRAREPIAVVGLGCRFPGGADDPQAFWALLRDGRDAVGEVPADRWDIDALFDTNADAPSKISTRNGGFLDDISGFDPAFFGIAPREATTMDPQQRLLLEVTWEALEHGGIAADQLAGSPTGVFIGICNSDYYQRLIGRGTSAIDAYMASGNAHSVVAGRIAYCLGLQGPAIAIDTACSSSLVALHAACRSLRSGETNLALCGGVNVLCSPEASIALSKAHMLAPDGRCKTFSDRADGFSRGEGCGVVVLKRLADAQAGSNRILAVIRGTATNQDGRSSGLTVPNGPAQEAVIRAALADAGVEPAAIGYVEAHGTGTSLGDPIEVRALARALGTGRPADDPLLIGSVKTNIGHLESAAGIAGVIKVVLSLQHERIPPHLHFDTPSRHIAWSDYRLKVPPAGQAWPSGARPRLAGVSSFGFSGTNAHAIIEEAPRSVAAAPPPRPLFCLPLSARTDAALKSLAARHADALAAGDLQFADVVHTLASGRAHLGERLAIVAADAASADAALRAAAAGEPHAALHRGTADPDRIADVVFLFTGQGAQYPGMSRGIYDRSPLFRSVIDRCDALIGTDADGRTLKSVLFPPSAGDGAIHATAWTQPALFAVEYAMSELWRSWGITPAAVIGHSVGEYVAACVAGVFSLEDGLRLIVERGRLMQALPGGGAMAAVFAPVEDVMAAVAPMADRLAIAAINAPGSVVISGIAAAVDAVVADFAGRGVGAQKLHVSLGMHSPMVEPVLDAMEACAGRIAMQAPHIPVAWNLTGGTPLAGGAPDASYWRRHLRETVRFADGIAHLQSAGYRMFLEVGPHPTLLALAQQTLPDDTLSLPSLRRDHDDWTEITTSLAKLYVHGARIDWAGVGAPEGGRPVPLPTYPFERRRYWAAAESGIARRPSPGRNANPLVGTRLPTAAVIFETTLSPEVPAWLAEHRVRGAVLVAGPVFLEMAQAAARDAGGVGVREIENFVIHAPLVLGDQGRTVQVHLGAKLDGMTPFAIHSRAADADGAWQLHAEGRLRDSPATPMDAAVSIAELQERLGEDCDGDEYYARLVEVGIDLGAGFRSLRRTHQRESEVLARMALPAERRGDDMTSIHPVLLDGALQACGLALPQSADRSSLYLLTAIDRIALTAPLPAELWCRARLHAADAPDPAEWRADVTLHDDSGATIGALHSVRLSRTAPEALDRAVGATATAADDLFYRLAWERKPLPTPASPDTLRPAAPGQWILVGDQDGLCSALAARLRARGDTVVSLPATAPAIDISGTVVYLGALPLASRSSDDIDTIEACKELACTCPLRWLAAISNSTAISRVYLVTQGAQAVGDSMASGGRWQAPLWGLGRVLALEQPGGFGGLIDLPPAGSAEGLADILLAALDGADDEDQSAWRNGSRFVARVRRTRRPRTRPARLRGDATYLITGGFGGLGVLVARDMAERGARHIALLGRHPDSNSDAVRSIERAGAQVITLAGDVADADGMRALLARLAREAPPLRGIIHAATDFSTAPIDELTVAQVDTMLRAKVDGTVVLETLTRDLALDFVVLFSTTTALIGAAGFAHYAAANQFLDATAQTLDTPARRVLSVNWGIWSTMRASADVQRSYSAAGLKPIPAAQALDALGALLGGTDAQQMVAHIDWNLLKPLYEARRPRPLLSLVGNPMPAGPRPDSRLQGAGLPERLAGASADTRGEILLDFVRGEVAAVLDLETGNPVPLDLGLFEMGMDSLMSVELKRRLERGVGHTLPSTLTFNYPNIKALVAFLMRDLTGVANAGPDVSAAASAASAAQAAGATSADIDDLTDSEIEARLLARVEETR